jgi:hypothetical protein
MVPPWLEDSFVVAVAVAVAVAGYSYFLSCSHGHYKQYCNRLLQAGEIRYELSSVLVYCNVIGVWVSLSDDVLLSGCQFCRLSRHSLLSAFFLNQSLSAKNMLPAPTLRRYTRKRFASPISSDFFQSETGTYSTVRALGYLWLERSAYSIIGTNDPRRRRAYLLRTSL